ncbi:MULTISPECIES: APC family permease [unclassified Pseudomonas]|uniref:APC family permease n=1 Tax=unclassified Pseudomonas TaxID=196821 RepID=UPI000CCFE0EB|nr:MULTISPECIES: APC family permease [unclassified Pseudomonas]POA57460.1 APC family permease [Pseudomonas sp. FW507-12TSA]
MRATTSTAQPSTDSTATGSRLVRRLSLSDVLVYGLLYFCPLAPTAVFGIVYGMSGGMAALVYAVAALAMTFSAISYSEMAKSVNVSGSVYRYVSLSTNAFTGFVTGWLILLDYFLLPALLSILTAIGMVLQFPESSRGFWILAFIWLPALLNIIGLKLTIRVNKLFLLVQLVTLGVFFVYSLWGVLQHSHAIGLLAPIWDGQRFELLAILSAIPVAALSFVGFDAISALNEEASGGGRTISRATLMLLLLVSLLFFAQVYLVNLFVPAGTQYDTEQAETAFYTLSRDIVGAWFQPIMIVVAGTVSGVANAIVSQMTTSRLIFSMARDGRFPAWLARLDRRGNPVRALLFVAIVSSVVGLVAANQVELLVTLVTFGALFAYITLHLSLFQRFRKHPERHWFKHVVSPLAGILILVAALASMNDNARWLGSAWLCIGLVLALILHRQGRLGSLPLNQ